MARKLSLEEKSIMFQYQDLHMIGVFGFLEAGLEIVRNLYINETGFDTVEVLNEQERSFLSLFKFNPPIDITLIKDRKKDTSIVTYSLDRKASFDVLSDIINLSGYKITTPNNEFTSSFELELNIEKVAYEDIKALYEIVSDKYQKTRLEDVFGFIRYSNFLHYKDIPFEDRIRIASSRFNLDLPIKK